MNEQETVTLTRDVLAVAIPMGDKITLPSGETVTITQRLGGNFTVMSRTCLARIDARDADALGKDIPAEALTAQNASEDDFNEDMIWRQLKTCYDPEIPVNIVDLGLVYSCNTQTSAEGKRHVDVKMTLTAPGCGMGPVIAEDAKSKVESIPGVESCNVEVVWDPPWNQGMMSEAAKLQMGLL